jgi:hypothetical protein
MNVEGKIIEKRELLSDEQLREQITLWELQVENASGFTSAKEAAILLKGYVAEANRRGWNIINKHLIKKG